VRAGDLPVIVIGSLLFLAGVYHLLAPESSERLLSNSESIRIVGIALSLLGAWCLFFPTLAPYLVGIPVLLSGLARFFAPQRMIKLNTWTSRYVHGVLMLLGALACGLLLAALSGCDTMSKQIDQKVAGVMHANGQPGQGLSVRLQSGGSNCDSNSLSFTTDANGAFSGARKVDVGKLAVIVQNDTLCVLEGQSWRVAWFGTYGPAPDALSFRCNRDANGWKCTMNGLESREGKA
jgi:hypothetical protein